MSEGNGWVFRSQRGSGDRLLRVKFSSAALKLTSNGDRFGTGPSGLLAGGGR